MGWNILQEICNHPYLLVWVASDIVREHSIPCLNHSSANKL